MLLLSLVIISPGSECTISLDTLGHWNNPAIGLIFSYSGEGQVEVAKISLWGQNSKKKTILYPGIILMASKGVLVIKYLPANIGDRRRGCDSWVGKIPSRRKW